MVNLIKFVILRKKSYLLSKRLYNMKFGLVFVDLYEFPHLIVQLCAIKLIKLN